MTDSSSAPSSTPHRVVDPSEVGWQFVPEYYKYVNQQPERLHCFYTKKSTFIHGTEGEELKACHGQQEIHQKIQSLNFQGCKVYIHSVDALSSADGGILIQVIGEMSNNNEAWRKFVQTFFLAEQPNGYFVLNDIFRFLREDLDSDAGSDAEGTSSEPWQPGPPEIENQAQQPEEQVQHQSASTYTVPVPTELTPPSISEVSAPVEEPPTTVSDIPEPPSQTVAPAAEAVRPNGIHVQEPTAPVPPPAASVSLPEKPKSPAPPPAVPAAAAAIPLPIVPPPVAVPTAPAPAAPKTWATLAATNSKKWGSAVAQDSRGMTEAIPSTPTSGTQTPSSQRPPSANLNQGGRTPHPAYVAAQSLTHSHCFVKGVTEPISQTVLTNFLTSRFGPLKDMDIVRSKACAFFEFHSLDSAKRAIVASLPLNAGGEGGLWVDAEGGPVRIVVETKKERGERPVTRPRGGAPNNGEVRGGGPVSGGSFRGRGGGGRGRGAPAK